MKTLLYSLLIVVGLAFSVKAQQASSNIMITEFQYRAVSGNNDSLEFVEFMNTTNEALDISGVKLSYGTTVKHTFPANTVLSPYQIVVVAHFPVVLQREYNMTNTPVGINGATGGMSNSGTTIYLRSANNDVLDQVTYTTSLGNLTGKTVEFCDLTLDNANTNASSNWAHSTTPVLRTDNSHNNYAGQLMYGTPGYLVQNCQWPQSQANPCDDVTVTGTVTGCGADASVVGAGGTPTYTYEWSNAAISATVNNLVVGEAYTVTIEDANGCTGIVNYVPVACVVDPVDQFNDECATATAVTVGQQCTPIEGNLLDATESMEGCTGIGSANDVWYSFVATTNNLLISVVTEEDVVLEILQGSCGALTSIDCVDAAIENEFYSANDFVTGNTYFVRVFAYDSDDLMTGDFSICVNEINIPANDECEGAIVLSVAQECTPIVGNLHGATESMEGCAGWNDANDVWYSFVATSNAHIINVSTEIDVVLEVFNGSCGTMESLSCVDDGYDGENYNSSDFVIGQTYFVRIYGYYPDELGTGEFTICVLGLESPANDECADAVVLTIGEDCIPTSGNLLGATESLEGCAGEGAANDLWYSFIATSNALDISVTTVEDVVLQVFGGSCGTLVDIMCTDDNFENENYASTDFVVGQTYFVRVYAYDYNDLGDGDFTICVQEFTPVINNDCETATTLVSSTTCTPVLGTLVDATISELEDDCNPYGNRDVWYSFVAQATNTTITVEGLDWMDAIVSVFEGACGDLTEVNCQDDGVDMEELQLSNLTVGNTYLIRVTEYYGGYEGSTEFSICVTHVAPADPCADVTITGTVTGCGAEAEVTAAGGTNPYTFEWSNGEETASVSNLVVGETYTITITDNNGCTGETTYVPEDCPIVDPCVNVVIDGVVSGCDGDVTVEPTGGNSPYTYLWSNGETTQGALVMAGEEEYFVTITDANGCTATVEFDWSPCASLSNVDGSYALNVYPNPTANQVTVEIETLTSEQLTIEFINAMGQVVMNVEVLNSGKQAHNLSLSDVSTGMYIISIKGKEFVKTERLNVIK